MRHLTITVLLLLSIGGVWAQAPLKLRPDAFAPEQDAFVATKVISMASTVEEMSSWDRYPTYEVYLAMMQRWAQDYPDICTLDTIGTSIRGRLILAAHIEGNRMLDLYRPQFFYSSTIHGDEVTGYVMMLRLIDTLLSSSGTSQRLTDLVNATAIYINPLANPDGTYFRGNTTVQGSIRYNANGIDLNRSYPDPFAIAKPSIPQENEAMINYFTSHNFRLSANLHGGSEVMNYPWDCFTTMENPHPYANWWREACGRFVDTCRLYDNNRFRDVNNSGVIAGGDWYVIHGGRQDYVNYYHNCLELTMEISSVKTLSSDQLPTYWHMLASSFINYIAEIHNLPAGVGVDVLQNASVIHVYPNPVVDRIVVDDMDLQLTLFDFYGREVASGRGSIDVSFLSSGVYLLRAGASYIKIIKK